eukprot:6931804-Lingulodinium_polyedra.AAC.1
MLPTPIHGHFLRVSLVGGGVRYLRKGVTGTAMPDISQGEVAALGFEEVEHVAVHLGHVVRAD